MDQHQPPGQPDPAQSHLDVGDAEVERSLPADLLASSRLYHTGKDYLDLLDFASRLRSFAPFNAMVLQVQKPGLAYAASAWDWEDPLQPQDQGGRSPLGDPVALCPGARNLRRFGDALAGGDPLRAGGRSRAGPSQAVLL
jgi:hypothetical protein